MSLSSRSFGQMSTGQKTMSVYGGAGGSGTRISVGQIDYLTRSGAINMKDLDLHVDANEKATLQNLNDRLASYLEKVHKLEKENERLEKQIAEWYTSKTVISHDYSAYMATIEDLQNKIREATMVNTRILLEIDNSKLAADDFKVKYENELSMRQAVEGDIAGLKRVMDDLTLCKMDLETQLETLKEELIMLKRNHEEDLAQLRNQMSGQVNVEVDAGSQVDLNQIMTEIREHYEALIGKNRKDLELWYQNKTSVVEKDVVEQTTNLQTSRNEIKEQKNILQKYQIELQSHLSMKSSLEASLLETQQRYANQLSGLQEVVTGLEAQLISLTENIKENDQKYGTLLDIKTRLELEISEYRRLLDGEDSSSSSRKVITKTTVVEETYVNGVKVETK
ncbi:keratin, type I cytoskeletal 13-like isoform X2 [Poecilia latipinna]|uniref:keratin, type I cytoskeletal 13-like isoform X1 n=1 Tax=Poecilia latipinna TaxID=48699 RepID=UPI00072DB83D|nr:PREDICTED: keratin, type I cytoskeletal 13-like isoform X1 [Poecilia latipinna]XP_014914471.1 PREDICTED: keratin, type I cytoskeletal 13-like isoform X2 [Poecilia latipinna]